MKRYGFLLSSMFSLSLLLAGCTAKDEGGVDSSIDSGDNAEDVDLDGDGYSVDAGDATGAVYLLTNGVF